MIDKLEFAKVLATLAALYPRFKLEDTTISAYYTILGDLDIGLLKAAALQIGATSKWFPAAAELRDAAFDLLESENGLPTPGEAWNEVLKRINYYEPPKESEFSSPIAYQALQSIGGNRVLCTTPEDMLYTARARFIQAYETLVNRERYAMRMLPEVREVARRLSASRRPELESGS